MACAADWRHVGIESDAQNEYKSRRDWVTKEIHLELCKLLMSDFSHKWYIRKLESVWKNKMHKIFRILI